MQRICKYCGTQYDGDPDSSCCPDCAAKQRKTSLRDRVCTVCGITFSGGPSARYCPNCRKDRQREIQRRFHREGPKRKLGSTDTCVICGKQYIVEGGLQKYCPDCALEQYKILDNAKSREWQRENTTPAERKKTRQAATAEIPCAVCGKLFAPRGPSTVCSPECAAELKRRASRRAEDKRRETRRKAQKEQRDKMLAAMTAEELQAYRAAINARARENYRRRKEREKENEK